MIKLILPKSDLHLSSVSEISSMCSPLRIFGITAFSHTKIYDDGTFIDMADNYEMIDHFYYSGDLHKYYLTDTHPQDIGEGFFLYSSAGYNESIHILREALNMDNIIVFIERYSDHFSTWNFASARGNPYILNFYLNNLDKLKAFIEYFKNEAQLLIKKFDSNRIIRIFDEVHCELPTINLDVLPKQHPIAQLTKKEIECLYWVRDGKSAKEIAQLCNRSTKTIQNHLQSIRQKLSCKKISVAIQLLNKTLY